jgi:penicillin-binding protein 1A
MYDHGAITYDEYQSALNENLIFTDTEEYLELHPEDTASKYESTSAATTWVVDVAIREVQDYLMETYGISRDDALTKLNTGGYQIYTTVDMDMQAYVEEKFLDLNNLVDTSNLGKYTDTNGDGVIDDEDTVTYPQCAFIAMNYQGEILAVVGATGEKTGSLVWNYATRETRQPGSTIKPITTYGYAIYSDLFHWGSQILDYGLTLSDGTVWPKNYSSDSVSSNYSGQNKNLWYGLMKSLNTISARLCDALTPESVYAFATDNMGLELTEIDSQGNTDKALSPLSVGALTYGVTMENMVNAYVPYGNGGTYYSAHIVSRLEQGNHELIYENNGSPYEAVDPETAYVMNHLLKNVVSANGTAGAAQLTNKTVVGKTGTTQNWDDLWFIGLTEDFVSGIWIGYAERSSMPSTVKSAQIWYNAIGEYANSLETDATYPECDTVIEAAMCTNTGLIAGDNCPKGETGYWKSTNAPKCTSCTAAVTQDPDATSAATENGNEESTETTPASTSAVVEPAETAAPAEPQPAATEAPVQDPPTPEPEENQ